MRHILGRSGKKCRIASSKTASSYVKKVDPLYAASKHDPSTPHITVSAIHHPSAARQPKCRQKAHEQCGVGWQSSAESAFLEGIRRKIIRAERQLQPTPAFRLILELPKRYQRLRNSR